MDNLEDKPEGEANTSPLNDPIKESAAALNAYLNGGGAPSPFQAGSAMPYNRADPMHPVIIPSERSTSNRKASLGTYVTAALLFFIAVRESVLIVRPLTIAKATISKRREPSNLKTAESLPPSAISEDKAAREPASAPAGQGAAVTTTPFSSHSPGDKDSQPRPARPAQPTQGETKPWSETVKAFKQLFTVQRASQAEGWETSVMAAAIPPSSLKPEPDSVP